MPCLPPALLLGCSQPGLHFKREKRCRVSPRGALHGALLYKKDATRGKVLEGLSQEDEAHPEGCRTAQHYPAAGLLTHGDGLEMSHL